MPVEPTALSGLLVVREETHGDGRGFFRQTYQHDELAEVATFTRGDPPGERVRLWVSEGLGNAFCAVTEPTTSTT